MESPPTVRRGRIPAASDDAESKYAYLDRLNAEKDEEYDNEEYEDDEDDDYEDDDYEDDDYDDEDSTTYENIPSAPAEEKE